MPEPSDLASSGNAAIVAPAGHGKTELIAKVAALCRRSLILTHTHAGVHAIRSRLKRLGIERSAVAVDTIAGWSTRYSRSFPGTAQPPPDPPENAQQWDQLYRGASLSLNVRAVREVVEASYDRVLIDEYQDCGPLQHDLAKAMSSIVPTVIFGDPMQGIFEFAGATLAWEDDIHPHFPYSGTLPVPHRWRDSNPALGEWIAETREKLIRGERIDLMDPRIAFRESDDAFDMGTLFDGIDGKSGTFAAIHCNKSLCYNLAKAAGGGYQAIEEIAANRLRRFARHWDLATGNQSRLCALISLLNDCFLMRSPAEGEEVAPEEAAINEALQTIAAGVTVGSEIEAAQQMIALSRKHPRWKLYRNELWRDADRAAAEVAFGRAATMTDAVANIRTRVSVAGRRLPKRTISTPLLLKGLEFDHVVVPDAVHFARESRAQAKLFYVAISRATRSLTISAPDRYVQFPAP